MNLFQEFLRTFSVPIQAIMGRTVSKPFSIGIGLTQRCNSRCSMCDFWKTPGAELNFSQVKHILDNIREFGVGIVNYSAHGEIFVNRDIKKILEYTKMLDFTMSLNTNALALANEEIASFVGYKINPFLISVGLDTTCKKTYKKVRGIPDGLERVKKALTNLKKAGICNITIGSVILDYNLDDLTSLVVFAEEMGLSRVRFTAYQRFFQQKDDTWLRLQDKVYLLSLRKKMDELVRLKTLHPIIRNSLYYLRRVPDFYASSYFFPIKCIVGYLRMDISETGDVTLCPFMEQAIGNVFKSDLSDIWFSEKANMVRRKMVNGHCPGCWLSCYAEENIRFTLRYGLQANWEGLQRYLKLRKRLPQQGGQTRIDSE